MLATRSKSIPIVLLCLTGILLLTLKQFSSRIPGRPASPPIATAPVVEEFPLQPVRRGPVNEDPGAVADERMFAAWDKLKLKSARFSRWAQYVHAYRLFSELPEDLKFSEEHSFRDPLLNADIAGRYFDRLMLTATTHGVVYAASDGSGNSQGESHLGYTLLVLADANAAASLPIQIANETRTIADVVRAGCANYSHSQEPEFMSLALMRYSPRGNGWTNKHGQKISFSDVCDRLVAREPGEGPCYGCHRLYALAFFVQADASGHFFSPAQRQIYQDYLKRAMDRLRHTQTASGVWSRRAVTGTSTSREALNVALAGTLRPQFEDVDFTGHSLEWLALTDPSESLAGIDVETGCQAVAMWLLDMPPAEIEVNYTGCSHLGMALRAWYPNSWARYLSRCRESQDN